MKKAAIYVRANTKNEITQQIYRQYNLAEKNGYKVSLRDIYTDVGNTVKPFQRPALSKLVTNLGESGINALFVASPDRISRDFEQLKIFSDLMGSYDVSLEFSTNYLGVVAL